MSILLDVVSCIFEEQFEIILLLRFFIQNLSEGFKARDIVVPTFEKQSGRILFFLDLEF